MTNDYYYEKNGYRIREMTSLLQWFASLLSIRHICFIYYKRETSCFCKYCKLKVEKTIFYNNISNQFAIECQSDSSMDYSIYKNGPYFSFMHLFTRMEGFYCLMLDSHQRTDEMLSFVVIVWNNLQVKYSLTIHFHPDRIF